MKKTKIDWADASWNPITGCYHDCKYCYARKIAWRFGKNPDVRFFSNTKNRLHYLNDRPDNPYPFGFEPTFHKYRLNEPQTLKKSSNIFVGSMSDIFGDWAPESWSTEVFDACRKAPQHNYLFLTKNPSRYEELAENGLLPKEDNFFFGTTVTAPQHKYFTSDTYNIFLSIEPITSDFPEDTQFDGVDWVIVGAETGNRANKVVPSEEWIEHILAACNNSDIPCFLKSSIDALFPNIKKTQEYPKVLKS